MGMVRLVWRILGRAQLLELRIPLLEQREDFARHYGRLGRSNKKEREGGYG